MDDMDDDALLAALELPAEERKTGGLTAEQERVIAGFEDIVRFVKEHGRRPSHGEDRDIFERLYAVRLDRLHDLPEFHDLLAPIDEFGLLAGGTNGASPPEPEDDEALLAELGLAEEQPESLTTLRHVRPHAEINAADEVARREPCADFDAFKPLFGRVRTDLEAGVRRTRRFQRDAEIKQGDFFILGGQMAYVAEIGEEFRTEQDRRNAKLRVIYDNRTESHGLLRSFQRALYKDEAGRRVTAPGAGPLFDGDEDDDPPELPSGDESGTIYVLRSRSSDPRIASNRAVLHKIGVTGNDVEKRIANAALDPTFLMSGVEVIATYRLYDINRSRLENLIHRFFAAARLDLEIKDRFGNPVRPQEWFLVPLPVIDEVVRRIEDRTIVDYEYDPTSASVKRIGA